LVQEPFDGQGEELHKALSERQKIELSAWLRQLSPDHVELAVSQLYQCIMLNLIGHSHDEDYANPENYR
jgi:hypothetical protein